MAESSEKRVYPRYDINRFDDYIFQLHCGKDELIKIHPINISVGGICGFYNNGNNSDCLQIGQKVTIYLNQKSNGELINRQRIHSEVRWKTHDKETGKIYFGNKFNMLTLDLWQNLSKLTNQN